MRAQPPGAIVADGKPLKLYGEKFVEFRTIDGKPLRPVLRFGRIEVHLKCRPAQARWVRHGLHGPSGSPIRR
eukprot:11928184-Heterocapsa_arctica.AAC.1